MIHENAITMKTHLIRAAIAALGMFLCAVVGGAVQDYARAIAAVNRQIEEISEKPKVIKTDQRVVRIEYSAQDGRVICFDKTGKAFLTLERRESGRFEGVFTTPAISPFIKGGHGVRASMLCPIYIEEKDLQKETPAETRPRSTNSCFGIPCDFSGKLKPEQEKGVPSELCGAFYVEFVRDISEADLQQILKRKEKVAEETHNGVKYIAVKTFRCVQFSKEVSGMMIVIERYRIVDKQPTPRQDHTP